MRHRISIRSFSTSRNSAGEELRTWSELAEVWAAIEHKTGGSNEVEQGSQTTAKISAVFRIRRLAGVNEKMMIVWNSKAWNIRSILPDNDFTYQLLECEHYYDNNFEATLLDQDPGEALIDDEGHTLISDI